MKYIIYLTTMVFFLTIDKVNAQNDIQENNLVQHLNESFRDKLTPEFYNRFIRLQRLVTLENDCSNHPDIKFFRNEHQPTHRLILENGCREQMEAMLINIDGDIVFNSIFFYPTVDFKLINLPEDTYYLKVITGDGSFTKSVQLLHQQ